MNGMSSIYDELRAAAFTVWRRKWLALATERQLLLPLSALEDLQSRTNVRQHAIAMA